MACRLLFLVQGKMWVIDPLKSTGAKKAVQIGISLWTFGDTDEEAVPRLLCRMDLSWKSSWVRWNSSLVSSPLEIQGHACSPPHPLWLWCSPVLLGARADFSTVSEAENSCAHLVEHAVNLVSSVYGLEQDLSFNRTHLCWPRRYQAPWKSRTFDPTPWFIWKSWPLLWGALIPDPQLLCFPSIVSLIL